MGCPTDLSGDQGVDAPLMAWQLPVKLHHVWSLLLAQLLSSKEANSSARPLPEPPAASGDAGSRPLSERWFWDVAELRPDSYSSRISDFSASVSFLPPAYASGRGHDWG